MVIATAVLVLEGSIMSLLCMICRDLSPDLLISLLLNKMDVFYWFPTEFVCLLICWLVGWLVGSVVDHYLHMTQQWVSTLQIIPIYKGLHIIINFSSEL